MKEIKGLKRKCSSQNWRIKYCDLFELFKTSGGFYQCKGFIEDIETLAKAEERKRIVKEIEKAKSYCHEANFQKGCVECVENHKRNVHLHDVIELINKIN